MYAVIDIGSNSVRLMLNDGEKTLSKESRVTRLSQGIANGNLLNIESIIRTANAVSEFVEKAKGIADDIWIFATEAVRRASNAEVFTDLVAKRTGVAIQVLTGEQEALVGFVGASNMQNCTVVDIGGASTEIVCGDKGEVRYAKSVGIGAVVLRDSCGESNARLEGFLREKTRAYGYIPKMDKVIAISGTATTVVAMLDNLEPYDSSKVHNRVINRKEIFKLYNIIKKLSLEERKEYKGLQPSRADIIVGAMYELMFIMDMMNVYEITVSESDNLEGFLKLKLDGKI